MKFICVVYCVSALPSLYAGPYACRSASQIKEFVLYFSQYTINIVCRIISAIFGSSLAQSITSCSIPICTSKNVHIGTTLPFHLSCILLTIVFIEKLHLNGLPNDKSKVEIGTSGFSPRITVQR